jgi:Type I phosphodiesterase / nucleotide pyrophosphatase
MRSVTPTIADVLPSVCARLGVPDTEDVLGLAEKLPEARRFAVLLVDGMGLELLPFAAPHAPLLAALLAGEVGRVDELSSVFPSTTPTNLVSSGTGSLPGRHGVLGFTLNVPGTDRVLTHVNWKDDPRPDEWQPVPSLFTRANAAGIETAVVGRSSFEGSGLTVAAYGPTRYVGADDPDLVADRMLAAFADASLVHGYHADLDTAAHAHGVDSPQWHQAAAGVDRLIRRIASALPPDVALLVTADHGGFNVPAGTRIDLGVDPELSAGLRVVAGEPRVRYLHTVPGAQADVLATWRGRLAGRADVLDRDEAIGSGLFGPVSPEHALRLGDVVVICTGDTALLATGWESPDTAKLVGFHGGLTPAEMRIPLIQLSRVV